MLVDDKLGNRRSILLQFASTRRHVNHQAFSVLNWKLGDEMQIVVLERRFRIRYLAEIKIIVRKLDEIAGRRELDIFTSFDKLSTLASYDCLKFFVKRRPLS